MGACEGVMELRSKSEVPILELANVPFHEWQRVVEMHLDHHTKIQIR